MTVGTRRAGLRPALLLSGAPGHPRQRPESLPAPGLSATVQVRRRMVRSNPASASVHAHVCTRNRSPTNGDHTPAGPAEGKSLRGLPAPARGAVARPRGVRPRLPGRPRLRAAALGRIAGRGRRDDYAVDGAPEVVLDAIDLDEHLVQVPAIAGPWRLAAEPVGEGLRELSTPAPDRFVGHLDAALGQERLNVSEAERKRVVQPDRKRDQRGRIRMAVVRTRITSHPATMPSAPRARQHSGLCDDALPSRICGVPPPGSLRPQFRRGATPDEAGQGIQSPR